MTNFYPYLQSISQEYKAWWEYYTITNVEGEKPKEKKHKVSMFDFGMMAKTVNPKSLAEEREKTEILPILEGLRKYQDDHVLLSGKPGSGKSTALLRLLLEESTSILEKCATAEANQPYINIDNNSTAKIPVLVELRYYQTSILDLISKFLQRHDSNLNLDTETLTGYLKQEKFLLLIDGVNELPFQSARDDLFAFRQHARKTTPMIFTTRDLGVGGDLNIEKKLEMQALNSTQMEEFIRAYLPEKGQAMLDKLQGRLLSFAETPLLLKMLCDLYEQLETIPDNLAQVFRLFTQQYDHKIKADVPVKSNSRNFWADILQELAWKMTAGETATEIKVAISKLEAETIIRQWLKQENLSTSLEVVRGYLDDLLKYHLIQIKGINQIEFHHQLIQEYYAAEKLLKILQADRLSDEQWQWNYLNYLKWTEPIAFMMALIDTEVKAVRIVKLALSVDYQLGARLAGEVKAEFQSATVALVKELDLPPPFKIRLFGKTKSNEVIDELDRTLSDSDYLVRWDTVRALVYMGNEQQLVDALINTLSDPFWKVLETSEEINEKTVNAFNDASRNLVEELVKIGCKVGITHFIDVFYENRFNNYIIEALEKIQERALYFNVKPKISEPNPSTKVTIEEEILTAIYQLIETMSDAPKNQFNFYKEVTTSAVNVEGDQYNNPTPKTPAETAKEIQELLKQLKEGNPDLSEEKLLRLLLAKNPTLKAKLLNGLKEGGLAALSVFTPLISIPVQTIKGILEE